MSPHKSVEEAVEAAAAEYRSAGYEVVREVAPWAEFPDLRADLLARNGSETVIVEVATTNEMRARESKVTRLAHAVAARPSWRLDLRSVGQIENRASLDPLDTVEELLNQAQHLTDERMWIPAFLTAWTVVEATLRELVPQKNTSSSPSNSRSLVKSAFALGLLSRGTMDSLLSLASVRNALAHGVKAAGAPNMETVTRTLVQHARDLRRVVIPEGKTHYDVDELIEWFLENYEDPANGVPYDGREGGYQYALGGPYEPIDELQDAFPDAAFPVVEEAANRIVMAHGSEWIKKGQY